MGIYIKGIDMPPEGCEVIIRIQPDGTVLDEHGVHLYAKAVPVPSHGRLVDADEIIEKIKAEGRNQAKYYADRHDRAVRAFGDCFGLVKSAPTIIQAEEGE